MKRIELRPCPFCAHAELLATQAENEDGTDGAFRIECLCGAMGPSGDCLADAEKAWNTRNRPIITLG